jgi:hypothetical protein
MHRQRAGEHAVALGVVLVLLGVIFLLESLDIIDAGPRELWPIVPITLGVWIVYERVRRARR